MYALCFCFHFFPITFALHTLLNLLLLIKRNVDHKTYNDMGNISNVRVQNISHIRGLSNYRELLIYALEVNSP